MPDIGKIGHDASLSGLESEFNLPYYRARYYDQNAGRFASEDPSKFSAGVNFYAYVWNLPTTNIDPSGLDPNQNDPNQAIIWWWRLFGPKPTCPEPKCSIQIRCLPTHGTQFTHCTVVAWDGASYTAFDGMPSGNVFWSKVIIVTNPGSGSGGDTIFSANVPCGCAQKAVDAINGGGYTYNVFVQNSNTAAQKIATGCGASPKFPWKAWGAW